MREKEGEKAEKDSPESLIPKRDGNERKKKVENENRESVNVLSCLKVYAELATLSRLHESQCGKHNYRITEHGLRKETKNEILRERESEAAI